MKIGIMSDLHMEFKSWTFKPKEDVFYICAGDINSYKAERELFCNDHYDHMFSIKGNHDYYGDSFSVGDTVLREVDGITIAGAPLWTDLSNGTDWFYYKQMLSDYGFIAGLFFDTYMEAHRAHREFLFSSNADIIVSHHCPSYMSVHPKYKNDILNPCFATELGNHILAMPKPPKLWIHGHTHEEFDYMIGDTRIICHPRGYPREKVWYESYEPKIVEI